MVGRLVLSTLLLLASQADGLDNGLARLPPMGYNTWNDFGCLNITAANVMLIADKMVANGMQQAGYQYVNIDDCWAVKRDKKKNHALVPDPKAFPDGIKALSDYVHSKGLKLGIYTDRGVFTCERRPGSKDHEEIDAQTFADWGIDFLKEDSCFSAANHKVALQEYATMRDALNKTGRPILFSLCGWREWYAAPGATLGNMWRITGDVVDWFGVYRSASAMSHVAKYGGPGGWNDPDMLIGSSEGTFFHLSPSQARAQFSLWCVFGAPLLVGSSMLDMSDFDLETYTDKEALRVNQDEEGLQGSLVFNDCPAYNFKVPQADAIPTSKPKPAPPCAHIWGRRLSGGAVAVVTVNYDLKKARHVLCDASCIAEAAQKEGQSFHARDVWTKQDLGVVGSVGGDLPPGSSAMYVLTPSEGGRVA